MVKPDVIALVLYALGSICFLMGSVVSLLAKFGVIGG